MPSTKGDENAKGSSGAHAVAVHARASSDYRPVTDDFDVDVEGMIRALPEGARVKGLFLDFVLDRAKQAGIARERVEQTAKVAPRRYLQFLDYPYEEYIRLAHATARLVYPRLPTARGLRLLGRGQYPMFLETVAGRVTFGIFGRDAERITPLGPKGWQMSLNFGKVEAEVLGPRHVRYHFAGMPAMLETMSLGVVEGALDLCGVRGTILLALRDPGTGSYDITWS